MSKPKILEIEEKSVGTILYESDEGTSGDVTCSNLTKYKYIEILFKVNGSQKSIKVEISNGAQILLDGIDFWEEKLWFYTKVLQISGNKLIKVRQETYNFLDSTTWAPFGNSTSNDITIKKVIGYM